MCLAAPEVFHQSSDLPEQSADGYSFAYLAAFIMLGQISLFDMRAGEIVEASRAGSLPQWTGPERTRLCDECRLLW